MKKMTMVLIGCFISFFLALLNSGYAEDVKSDFSVVFPKDDVVYLNGNPCLALMWLDAETGLGSKADFDAGAVYEILIWGYAKEPICRNWVSNTNMWILNTSIANEIGLESGEIYFWQVRRFSQSEGRMISTDMGSFSVEKAVYPQDFGGHLCGHVSTGQDFVKVTRNGDGHTEELDVLNELYIGEFRPGSYTVCAGDSGQCYTNVRIKPFYLPN
jgi:hypothetical protein